MEVLLLVLLLFNIFFAIKYWRLAGMMNRTGAATVRPYTVAPDAPGIAEILERVERLEQHVRMAPRPVVAEILERVERLEQHVRMAPRPVVAEEIEWLIARETERISAEQSRRPSMLATPFAPPSPPTSPQPAVERPVRAVLAPDEVATLVDALRLGAEAERLLAAETYEEVGRLLVSELIPERTATGLLQRADVWLRSVSGGQVRLIVPPVGSRPNGAEAEKVAERPIERGIYGHVTDVVRPGLRVGERVAIRASIEQGI